MDIDQLKNLPNNLNSLKTEVDKLDIDKLIPVPVDLSKLSSVPKNEVVKKSDFDNKLLSLNRKIVSNKAKDLLIENKLKKLKAFDSNYYHSKNYFDEDGIQNYLVFQSILKYFTVNSSWITKWESKGLSNESLEVVSTSSNTLTPSVNREKARLKFTGSILQQKIVTYRHRNVVKLYVVYEINFHGIDNYPMLANALFGAVKLTKNTDINKYKYSGYGIGFDGKGFFSHSSRRTGRNVIIFGIDMSSSAKIVNKGKDILILGLGPTFGLGEKALSVEKMFSINFTKANTKFCLNLHYNGANSYLFVNGTEIYKFTAKDSMIVLNNLYFGNISKDFSMSNMKKTGFNGYIYDFSVDYNSIGVSDIQDIHKYLMKKNGIV